MGYTNYWNFKPNLTKFPVGFINDVKTAIDYVQTKRKIKLNVTTLTDVCININGVEPEDYENFYISFVADPESHERYGVDSWCFCKTARMPYDIIVKAILLLAWKYHLLITPFTFDGCRKDKEFQSANRMCKRLGLI